MKIPVSATATDAGGYVPEQVYRIRVIDTKFTNKNSSGNPMTTLACEVIEPESVEINGEQVIIAGRKFQLCLTHDPEKTGWGSQEEVLTFCEKLGIEIPVDETSGEPAYDTDRHEEMFKGMEFDMVLRSKEEVKRYQAGPNKNKPILDGEGREISSGMRINARPSDVTDNCHPTRNQEVAARPF